MYFMSVLYICFSLLLCLVSASLECPKEYDHPIYEVTRTPKMDAGTVNQGNNAAKLGYLWGLSASETGGLETSAPSKKENDFTFQVLAVSFVEFCRQRWRD